MEVKKYSGAVCCVVGCHSTYPRDRGHVRFFCFSSKNLEQREQWIGAVKRKNPNGSLWLPKKQTKICSKHFITEKPNPTRTHPDYVPSIFPTQHKRAKKESDLKRQERFMKRRDVLSGISTPECVGSETKTMKSSTIATQTTEENFSANFQCFCGQVERDDGKTTQTSRHNKKGRPRFDDRLFISYDRKLRNCVFAEYSTYYRSGLFCDVAIYCPIIGGSETLSSVPSVEQDIWTIHDGPVVNLSVRWAKVKCHSLILSTISPMMKQILLSHAPATPVCSCNCPCDSVSHSQELYSLVLPHTPAIEVVKLLNQVYHCTAVSGRINFLVSRQLYETLELTSDNLWENDDFGESDLSASQVLPLGLSISNPVPISERVKMIKEKLDLKRKMNADKPVPQKLLKPNTPEEINLARVKKEARLRGGRLRVCINRIKHPSLTSIPINLEQQVPECNQMLFIPQTVAHVFADILDNLKLNKNRKILLGTVQTISQDAFMSDSLDLELDSNSFRTLDQTNLELVSPSLNPKVHKSTELISSNKRVVLKPISHQEVMANLGQLPATSSSRPAPVVLKKLNIQNTVYKGYSKANPVIIRRDIIPDPKELTGKSTPAKQDETKVPDRIELSKSFLARTEAQLGNKKEEAERYVRLHENFSGPQLHAMIRFVGQTKLDFLPVTSEHEYTKSMLDSIVASSGKISVVTIDHDRNQIFFCPVCDMAVEEHGVDAYCKHVLNVHKARPNVECQECGKQCLMPLNFIPHTFQHRLLEFSQPCSIALLGISSRQGKNIACTLASNQVGWDPANSLFNLMKALEIVYHCTTEKLAELFHCDKRTGKTAGTDQGVARVKEQYENLGLAPAQLQSKLNDLMSRDPNMFERKGVNRSPVHSPQLPCFAFQVQAELELVSAISFHELLDVAIIFENKQTKQLEAMSAVRMGFQRRQCVSLSIPHNFPNLMLPVLARLLNCPSVDAVMTQCGHMFNDYFQDYKSICNDVFALREIVNTVECRQCDRTFNLGSHKANFLYEVHKEMHLVGDCECTVSKKKEGRLEHMKLVHGYNDGDQIPESCNCKASFKSVRSKAIHMKKVHGVEVPLHDCLSPSCNMSFVTPENRDAHMQVGNHQVSTVCDQCGKSFGSSSAWLLHKNRNHKQLTCKVCFKTLQGSKSLKYHEARCETGSWKCHVCKKVHVTEEELEEHRRESHAETTQSDDVTCSVCFKNFRRLEYLRNHEKRVHFRQPNARGRHIGKKRHKPDSSKKLLGKRIITQQVLKVQTLEMESPLTINTMDPVDVVSHPFFMN